jgi:acyl-CoA oxidase
MGRYDGNIYEKYFEQVNISHKAAQIPKYFKTHVYPVLNKTREEESVLELDDE